MNFMKKNGFPTRIALSEKLGRPFSVWGSNPKYNTKYIDYIVRTKYVSRIIKIKQEEGIENEH